MLSEDKQAKRQIEQERTQAQEAIDAVEQEKAEDVVEEKENVEVV